MRLITPTGAAASQPAAETRATIRRSQSSAASSPRTSCFDFAAAESHPPERLPEIEAQTKPPRARADHAGAKEHGDLPRLAKNQSPADRFREDALLDPGPTPDDLPEAIPEVEVQSLLNQPRARSAASEERRFSSVVGISQSRGAPSSSDVVVEPAPAKDLPPELLP